MTPINSRLLTLFGRGATGPVAPGSAWALYLLDEGTGQTVGDSSGNGRDLHLGMDASADSTDPVWTTLGGVACLEGAGAQICVAKAATALAQPYSVVAIGRTSSTSHNVMLARGYAIAVNYGLVRVATTKALRLFSDTALSDGATPDATWFAGIGVANGAASQVWIYGGGVTTGNAGTEGITHHTLMGRWSGAVIAAGWNGQFAAAVIVAGAPSEATLNAWAEYLAAVKGVTL